MKVQYSDNGSTWTDVGTFTPVAQSSWDAPYDLSATGPHRYWRVLQNGGTTDLGYDWECYEIEWRELETPAALSGITNGFYFENANADGAFVFTGAPPATLTIDGAAVTFGTHADKLANGFKIRTASAPFNDSSASGRRANWTATYSTPQKPFVGSNHVQGKAQAN